MIEPQEGNESLVVGGRKRVMNDDDPKSCRDGLEIWLPRWQRTTTEGDAVLE